MIFQWPGILKFSLHSFYLYIPLVLAMAKGLLVFNCVDFITTTVWLMMDESYSGVYCLGGTRSRYRYAVAGLFSDP